MARCPIWQLTEIKRKIKKNPMNKVPLQLDAVLNTFSSLFLSRGWMEHGAAGKFFFLQKIVLWEKFESAGPNSGDENLIKWKWRDRVRHGIECNMCSTEPRRWLVMLCNNNFHWVCFSHRTQHNYICFAHFCWNTRHNKVHIVDVSSSCILCGCGRCRWAAVGKT